MKNICILFGGKSSEHEVSIMSAKNVFEAIDRKKFKIFLVYVNIKGKFFEVKSFANLGKAKKELVSNFWKKVDCAFPVMHGPNCEDGSMQGYLQTLGVKYVGSKVLGSALGMDKDIQKTILRANGLRVVDWLVVRKYNFNKEKLKEIKSEINNKFNYPVFVKPANMGSSVGVSKVKNESGLEAAIKKSFKYDEKIIIEKAVVGRELECAVLGSKNKIIVSSPDEIVVKNKHDFYDYDAKYFDVTGSEVIVPAKNISDKCIKEMKLLTVKVFTLLECSGFSRVDFFMTEAGEVIVNEINTIPGFTNISMFPKLMKFGGISYKNLITKLISLT